MQKIWSYLYTTATTPVEIQKLHDYPDFGKDAPLAGFGFGLPISRLYSQYFGGDLQVMSMEGYGTDAYLFLHRVGDIAEPNLNPHLMPSTANYVSRNPLGLVR
jgi:pyruvate dehydrogenase kinase 2/3/4